MSNITIFEEPSNLPTVRRESRRMDRMAGNSMGSMRRIQISNGRIFKRIVSGEQIGKAVPNQLDVIIVDWLAEPSRKFYLAAYDKDTKATLPDCWSNDGVRPEAGLFSRTMQSPTPSSISSPSPQPISSPEAGWKSSSSTSPQNTPSTPRFGGLPVNLGTE